MAVGINATNATSPREAEAGFAATKTKTSAISNEVAESISHRTLRDLPANGAKSDDAMALSIFGKAEPCSKAPAARTIAAIVSRIRADSFTG